MADLLSRVVSHLRGATVRASGPKIVTPAASTALTLAQVKAQCRMDDDDGREDAWFEDVRGAVDDWAQDAYGFSLLERIVSASFDCFPDVEYLQLPSGPVTELSTIQYVTSANVTVDWHTAGVTDRVYLDDHRQPERAVLLPTEDWPTPELRDAGGVIVTYKAGWPNAAAIPRDVTMALRQVVAHWWSNREAVQVDPGLTAIEVPMGAHSILSRQMRRPAA